MTTGTPRVPADIVRRAQAGDDAAWEESYRLLRPGIWSFIYQTMGYSASDAEEMTQDTFLKAWLNLTNPDSPAHRDPILRLGPWVYRIARNVCLDELRHRKLVKWTPWETYTATFHSTQIASDNPEGDALHAEDADEVQALLAQLPERERRVLVLREFGELSCTEVGSAVGLSRAGAKSLLFRARARFRILYAAAARQPQVPALVPYAQGLTRRVLPNGGGMRYRAHARVDGRLLDLGSYADPADALAARRAWEAQQRVVA